MKAPAKRTSGDVSDEIIAAMDREFYGTGDRVVAIVGAAYLDSTLDSLLRSIFVDHREDAGRLLSLDAPLGANGSRCQLAYCLGLITRDQRDDLKRVARIRNLFAHEFSATCFDEGSIRDHCLALKYPSQLAGMSSQIFEGDDAKRVRAHIDDLTATPREKFRVSVIGLLGALLRRIHYVRRDDHRWFSHDPDAPRGPGDGDAK